MRHLLVASILFSATSLLSAAEKPASQPTPAPASVAGQPAAERPKLTIAIVNMEQVQQEIGYQNLRLLSADKDLRAKMKELRVRGEELKGKIVAAEDDTAISTLTRAVQSLNTKREALMSLSRNNDDYRQALAAWIRTTYADKFDIVATGQIQQNQQQILMLRARYEDITDQVVAALQAELL